MINLLMATLGTSPATGDNFPYLLVGICAVSAIVIIVFLLMSKKNKNKKDDSQE